MQIFLCTKVAEICLLAALIVALLHLFYGSWSYEMDLELLTVVSKRLFICFWKLWILNCKTHWKMKLQSNQTLTGVFFPPSKKLNFWSLLFTLTIMTLSCSWRNSLQKHSSIPVGSCLGAVALSAILQFFKEIVIKGFITNWGVKESFQTSVSSHFAMYYVCRSLVIYRGAMKGKIVVTFSSSTWASTEFQLLYKWHFETGNWNIESADLQIRTAAKTWCAHTSTNLSPSCNRWETFELPKKVFGGVSLGCIWRLIAVFGNEFMCISGLFLKTDCSGR